jgi:hypothetical protein
MRRKTTTTESAAENITDYVGVLAMPMIIGLDGK